MYDFVGIAPAGTNSWLIDQIYQIISDSVMDNTTYEKIYIQYIVKSHMHPTILKRDCRHGNGPMAWGMRDQ